MTTIAERGTTVGVVVCCALLTKTPAAPCSPVVGSTVTTPSSVWLTICVTYRSYAVLGCSPSSSRLREFGRRETSFDALSVALSGGARLRAAPPSRLR